MHVTFAYMPLSTIFCRSRSCWPATDAWLAGPVVAEQALAWSLAHVSQLRVANQAGQGRAGQTRAEQCRARQGTA